LRPEASDNGRSPGREIPEVRAFRWEKGDEKNEERGGDKQKTDPNARIRENKKNPGREFEVRGEAYIPQKDFEAMNAFIEKHKLKPVIDKTFDYKDAPAAYDLMKSGDFLGKIVIRVAGN